jgi:hypothetical protein
VIGTIPDDDQRIIEEESPMPASYRDLFRGHSLVNPPRRLRILAERVRSHAVDDRTRVEDLSSDLRTLGHSDMASFCDEQTIPHETAEYWNCFGVPPEVAILIRNMARNRRELRKAADDFDKWNHVGISDYLLDKKFIGER